MLFFFVILTIFSYDWRGQSDIPSAVIFLCQLETPFTFLFPYVTVILLCFLYVICLSLFILYV